MSWFLRKLARLPLWLYRARLGWLLGHRFLKLEHLGRKSGLWRETVLEVLRHDPVTSSYVIASGFGPRVDWYRNLEAHPEARVEVAGRRFSVRALPLSAEEGEAELQDYSRRHPMAYWMLQRTLLHGRLVPLVRLVPQEATTE